jgi:predicted component of type VI protein secretion system
MPQLTLSFKGKELSRHSLKNGSTLIGSDPQCPLHIDSLAIAPRHADIVLDHAGCRVTALDAEWPIKVNHQVVDSAELVDGDILSVGKHTLRYSTEPIADTEADEEASAEPPEATTDHSPPPPERPRAYLQILSGEHIGRIIPINRNMIRLGKPGGDCAIIVRRDSQYFLSLLEGSTSMVNGMPIGDESIPLDSGNTIRIGDTELQFYY